MIKFSVLLLFVMAGFSGIRLPAEVGELQLPVMRLTLNHMQLWKKEISEDDPAEWKMSLSGTSSGIPGWEIDWCEEEAASMEMEDSTGRKAPKVGFGCRLIVRRIHVSLFPERWVPDTRARWVRVKGEVPFVISRREGVTVPVKVKLVKGVSVPLVLKRAALDGNGGERDVEAKLVVTDYRDVLYSENGNEKGKKILALEIQAEGPLGLRDFELTTADGMPVIVRDWSYERLGRSWEMDGVEDDELCISVRYSQDLRKCRGVIDDQVDLSGFSSRKEGIKAGGGCGAGGSSFSGTALPNGKSGQSGKSVNAQLTMLRIHGGQEGEDCTGAVPVMFHVQLSVKSPAVFGGIADVKKQSLEVTDSAGRVLPPAVFNLTWLKPESREEGMSYLVLLGKGKTSSSPGGEWLRMRGTLRVPVSTLQESPVYELPLVKGAQLQIPVPGAAPDGGDGMDVSVAGNAPTCRLKIVKLKDGAGNGKEMHVSLNVSGTPFDLDCFELVDEKGDPLKNASSSGAGSSFDSMGQEGFWHQKFTIGDTADLKLVRVRLRYRINAETVGVPVDCRIGLGGRFPRRPEGRSREPPACLRMAWLRLERQAALV